MVFSRFRSSFQKRHQRNSSSCVFQSFESFSGEGKKQHSWNGVFNVLNRFPTPAKNNTVEIVFSMFWIVFRRRQKTTQLKLHLQCFESVGKAHSVKIVFAGVFGAVSKNTENELLCSVRLVCFWSPDFRCLWTWRPAFLSHPHMSNKSRYTCLYYNILALVIWFPLYTHTCHFLLCLPFWWAAFCGTGAQGGRVN